MQQKTLMRIQADQVTGLNVNNPETGMDFQIAQTSGGYVAILGDGDGLPFYPDISHYDINDLLAGSPIPIIKDTVSLIVSLVIPNRANALAALRTAKISAKYTGGAGAIPLIVSSTLKKDTIFYRFLNLSSTPASDPRYVTGQLTAGTYLTTVRDKRYANSGFATVGRYALPIPLPASHVFKYKLPTGTAINVGTVAPMFGQAGGGVEVQLPTSQTVALVGSSPVSAY